MAANPARYSGCQTVNSMSCRCLGRRRATPLSSESLPSHVNGPTRGGELWLIPLDGSAPRKLDVDLSAAVDGQLGKIRLSPDGKQLAYVVGKSYQTETWVLENFLPKGAGAQK